MKVRYIRVSTIGQNPERQQNGLTNYIDVCSGAIAFKDRPVASELLIEAQNGLVTEISVKEIDRLGRDLKDLLNTLDLFTQLGVTISVDTIGKSLIDGKPNPTFKLMLSILGTVAEMEKNKINERTREGIEIAKAKGKFKGRKIGTKATREQLFDKYKKTVKHLKAKQNTVKEIASITGVSMSTVNKLKRLL